MVYFDKMDHLLSELEHKDGYAIYAADASEKKREYQDALILASDAIEEMRAVYIEIDDFDKIIELYTSIGFIGEQIEKLKLITSKAKNVTRKLQEFSKNGQTIF